jgi:hypothetical protein
MKARTRGRDGGAGAYRQKVSFSITKSSRDDQYLIAIYEKRFAAGKRGRGWGRARLPQRGAVSGSFRRHLCPLLVCSRSRCSCSGGVLGFSRSSQDYSLVFEQAQSVLIRISRGACRSRAARLCGAQLSGQLVAREMQNTQMIFFFEKSDKIEKSKSLIEN